MLKETVGKRIAAFLTILDEAGWLEPAIDSIRTFADPPKSLEELQQAVSTSAPGYDIHHIVEQTSAEQDGFPRSMIDAPENLVREAILDDRYSEFNRLYDRMQDVDRELRARGREPRLKLLRLYDHPNIQVRLKAATSTLGVAPKEGRRLLEAIAASQAYPQAADAGMLVDGLDDGTFKPT